MPDRPNPDAGSGPDTGDHDGAVAGEPASATPRWVKVFAIVVAGVVLLVILVALLGGGRHGPGRHLGSADDRHRSQPLSVTNRTPPAGVDRAHLPGNATS